MQKLAVTQGLNREPDIDHKPWHDYQRWLAAGEVRVLLPFAETLVDLIKETKSVRLRRDFAQLVLAIKAHALLHREHRKRNDQGMIVATIKEDYAVSAAWSASCGTISFTAATVSAIVRRLMSDLLATALEVCVTAERLTVTNEELLPTPEELEDAHDD